LVPQETEEMELPFGPEVLKRVLGLRKVHAEVEDIESQYKKERIELERKFNELRAPIYHKRKQMVLGEIEPEFPAAEEGSGEVASAPEDSSSDEEKVKGVPNFWLTALANHPVTGELIQQEDAPALEALEDVTIQYDETYNKFTLTFTFGENQYFKNRELVKTYELTDILDEKGPQLVDISGTEIEWKDGKNLCVKEIKKKQKAKAGKNKGQIRTITKQVPCPSFFHYFGEPSSADEEEEEEREENEEGEEERIKLNEEEDYEVAHAIRTCLIPDAVLWFTGEARDDDDYDMDDDEEGEDDEEGDDEEDDDEEEEEVAPKGKGKGGKNKGDSKGGLAAPNTAGGGEQPECKQN
jgi:nucleosome assembly protein 1-like 1